MHTVRSHCRQFLGQLHVRKPQFQAGCGDPKPEQGPKVPVHDRILPNRHDTVEPIIGALTSRRLRLGSRTTDRRGQSVPSSGWWSDQA
ncbi:hypothetical protein GCM10009753_39310 [Streptantibioticus ferralitis]